MEKVIATIVIIVLTLGLISYAIIGQMGSIKDTADGVALEQGKVSAVLQDDSLVTGSSVKNYVKQGTLLGYSVYDGDENDTNKITVSNMTEKVKDNSLYKIEKSYESAGSSVITSIVVTEWGGNAN